jgi:hypothetical protein
MTALLGLLLPLGQARAQSWMDRDDRVELRRSGEEKVALRRDGTDSGASKDFEVTLTVPLNYVSNVVSPVTDSVLAERGDWHAAPDLSVRWARQYAWAKLSAVFGADVDRYASVPAASVDSVYSTFKAALSDGKSDLLVPYLTYTETMYFEPGFRRREVSFHDVAAGVSSGIGLRGTRRIPYRDSIEVGDASALLDVRAGQRLSDIGAEQNTFVSGRLELAYNLSKAWTLELTPHVRARWYADYFGEPRRDYRPGVGFKTVWKPEWLRALVARSQIAFNLDFYRNYSNLPDKTYAQWEAGPSLEVSAKF